MIEYTKRFSASDLKFNKVFKKLPKVIQDLHNLAIKSDKMLDVLDYNPDDWGPALYSYLSKYLNKPQSDDHVPIFYLDAQNAPVIEFNFKSNKFRVQDMMGISYPSSMKLISIILEFFIDERAELKQIGHKNNDPDIKYLNWIIPELQKLKY